MINKTMTIGLPALNEEANIKSLLLDILRQKTPNFRLERIVISSDGSTDNTVGISKSLRNNKIVVLDNKKRVGQGRRQNQIIRLCDSDVLVLLNADIRITDKNFLANLVLPIINSQADLTSSRLEPTSPRNFFEKILCTSIDYKNSVFYRQNNGNNVHTCYGGARAFSKNLYKKLMFKSSVAEDAYSYFFCLSSGYKYKCAKNAVAYYKLPDNLDDHIKRSERYFDSTKILNKEFGQDIVGKEYQLSFLPFFVEGIKYFIKLPIFATAYLFITIFIKFKSLLAKDKHSIDIWDASPSTKGVVI